MKKTELKQLKSGVKTFLITLLEIRKFIQKRSFGLSFGLK